MKFKRRLTPSVLSAIDMTPLIDLGFSLLIIFMISTPLLEQSIPLKLPTQSLRPVQGAPEAARYQVISLDQNNQYFWGQNPVTASQLQASLKELKAQQLKGSREPVIHLRAHAQLPYQSVVTVIDWIEQAELSQISLGTHPGSHLPPG